MTNVDEEVSGSWPLYMFGGIQINTTNKESIMEIPYNTKNRTVL